MSALAKKLAAVFAAAFFLNLVWENLHASLYYLPSGAPITEALLLRSTFFDAVIITLLAAVFLNISYLRRRPLYALLGGIIIAFFLERYALANGRWAYRDTMPVIPFLNTGLSPTLQLGLLSYLIFRLLRLDK